MKTTKRFAFILMFLLFQSQIYAQTTVTPQPKATGGEPEIDAETAIDQPESTVAKRPGNLLTPEYRLNVGIAFTSLKVPLRVGYGKYLSNTYDKDHLIFSGGSFQIGLRKPMSFLFHEYELTYVSTELNNKFYFKDLNGVEKYNEISINLNSFKLNLLSKVFEADNGGYDPIIPEQRAGLGLALGFNSLKRNIYGFKDTDIVANNVSDNGDKTLSSTNSTHIALSAIYSLLFYNVIEIVGEYGYLYSPHTIQSDDPSSAKNNEIASVESVFYISGFYYSLGISGVF